MKKKHSLLIIFATFLLFGLTGCSTEPIPPCTPEAEFTILCNCPPTVPLEETIPALTYFTQNLFMAVLATDNENIVISPISVYYALAMVALGAREGTFHEFMAVLGQDPHTLAPGLSYMAHLLTCTIGGSTRLNLANSVWLTEELTIAPEFNQALINYYRASAQSRNLSSPQVIHEINRWICSQTNGLIEEMIKEIDPDTIMLLLNTLYLSARWSRAFNPMEESIDVFYPAHGEPIQVPFLSTASHINLSVSVSDYYESVFLPYDDGRLGFFLVRPTDGANIREFAANHNIMTIRDRREEQREVKVSMPALEKEFDITMNEQLQAMGLTLAFDDNLSNLSGLVEETMLFPVYISEVRQKVRIQVHSEGTEAVAATAVIVSEDEGQHQPIELIFNTPYIYLIYDIETSTVLFIGVVDTPPQAG